MNKRSKLIKAINEKFKPENEKYPVAFERQDDPVNYIVTSESYAIDPKFPDGSMPIVSYYEWYRQNDGVHPELENMIRSAGCWYEWENPACILIYED